MIATASAVYEQRGIKVLSLATLLTLQLQGLVQQLSRPMNMHQTVEEEREHNPNSLR